MLFTQSAASAAVGADPASATSPKHAFSKLAVSQALDQVTQATNFEKEGSREQAIPLIEAAVSVFKTQSCLAGGDTDNGGAMKPLLDMYLQMYQNKLQQLKKPPARVEDDFEVINQQEWQGLIQEDCYDFLEKDLRYEEDEQEADFELKTIPDEQPLRPFFFMQLIQKTIAKGAFLTEHLYIPREVWTQERLQLYDAEKKLGMIESLTREMRGLGILKKNNVISKNFKQVDSVLLFLRKLQTEIEQTMTMQEERAESARMSQISDIYTPMHQRSISVKGEPAEQHSVAFGQAQNFQNSGETKFGEHSGSEMNQSMFGRISSSFQIFSSKMTNKLGEALGFYGRPVDDYAKAIRDLFNECYFLEAWMRELLTLERKRTSEEDTLLTRLSCITKFLQEQILQMIMSDILMLLDGYYFEQTKLMLEPQRKPQSMDQSR